MKRYKKVEFKSIKDGVRDEYIVDPGSVQSIKDLAYADLGVDSKPIISPMHTYSVTPAIIGSNPRLLSATKENRQRIVDRATVKIAGRSDPAVAFSAIADMPGFFDCFFQDKIFAKAWFSVGSNERAHRYVSSDYGATFTAISDFPLDENGNAYFLHEYCAEYENRGPVFLNQTYYVLGQGFENEENFGVFQTDDYITLNHLFDLRIDGCLLNYFASNGDLFAWIMTLSRQLQLIKIDLDTQSFEIIHAVRFDSYYYFQRLSFSFFNGFDCCLYVDELNTLQLLYFDGFLVEKKSYLLRTARDCVNILGVSRDKLFFVDYDNVSTSSYRFHFLNLDFALFPNFFGLACDTYWIPHDISDFMGFTYYAISHLSVHPTVDATWCVNLPFDTSVNAYCSIDYPILALGKSAPKQIIVRHDALTAGQKIEIKYKIDKATSWTKLGESATVGAVAARLTFPDNLPGDFIQFQAVLVRSSAGLSPTGVNFDFLYLPLGLENAS